MKYPLKGRWERGDRIQLTAWPPLPNLCTNRVRLATASVFDFTGYDRKNRRGSRYIFPSLSMAFLGVQLPLSLLLGSMHFPLLKLLPGASLPVTPKTMQILESDPHQPFCCAPANSTFLSLLQAQHISKGQGGKTLPSLCFFQELIDLPSPIVCERNENHSTK